MSSTKTKYTQRYIYEYCQLIWSDFDFTAYYTYIYSRQRFQVDGIVYKDSRIIGFTLTSIIIIIIKLIVELRNWIKIQNQEDCTVYHKISIQSICLWYCHISSYILLYAIIDDKTERGMWEREPQNI